jgi:hypothetical protein
MANVRKRLHSTHFIGNDMKISSAVPRPQRSLTALAAVLTAAALALSGCTPPPTAQDRTIAASLPGGVTASVVFPGHDDVTATVEPQEVTPEMAAALPLASARVANVAAFTLTEGNFPSAGAQLSFHRGKAAPAGSFSFIAHWNEQDKVWEPVKTGQSEDQLTLTATVHHFSSYSIIDMVTDIVGAVLGDQESKEQLVNGTSQWLGVQAPPPKCDDTPKPDWASVTGTASINNIFTWCSSGSKANPDRLVVRATMNRSYAGYFRTAIEPVSARLVDGLSAHSSAGQVADGIAAKGFLDWKSIGAMMANSEYLVSADDETVGDIFPVMPFATYEFEFTKSALLLGWPVIEKYDTQLVAFSTSPALTFAGLVSGLMDLAVAKDNGDGHLAFLVLAMQINDCFKFVGVTADDAGIIPSADNLLSIVNCATYPANGLLEELAGTTADGAAQKKLTDGVQKVFQVVAAAEIGVTLGVAFNDFVTTVGAEKRLHFTPNGDGYKAFLAGPWKEYTTADKKYQFLYPEGWNVVSGDKAQIPVAGENVKVVNGKGETMTAFVTGFATDMGTSRHSRGPDTFRDLDILPVPGLKTVLDTTENKLLYQGWNVHGDQWRGFIGVHSFLKTDTGHLWSRGFDVAPQTGGAFGRTLGEQEPLTDVDPSLKGLDRLDAYKRTAEFHTIRAMLESLRDYVEPTVKNLPPREVDGQGWPLEKPWDADTADAADALPWAPRQLGDDDEGW